MFVRVAVLLLAFIAVVLIAACKTNPIAISTELPMDLPAALPKDELKPMTFDPSKFPAVEPPININKQQITGLKLSVTPIEGNTFKPVLEVNIDLQRTYRAWPFVWVYLGPVDGTDINPWRLIYGLQIDCDPSPQPMPLARQRLSLLNRGASTSLPWRGEAQYCAPVQGRAETRAPAGRYRVYVDVQDKPEWNGGMPAPPMPTQDQLVRLWSEELTYAP